MLLLSYSQFIAVNLIVLGGLLLGGLALDVSHAVEAMREKTSEVNAEATHGARESNKMNLSECIYDKGDFKKIIISATKAMDFFEKHIDHLFIVDAAIGTRIMEAQLALLQAGHPRLPSAVQLYLMTLQFKSELLSDEILTKFLDLLSTGTLTKERQKSLQDQLPWVMNASLWESPKVGDWKSLSLLKAYEENTNVTLMDRKTDVLDEGTSDNCIGKLFMTCSISDDCSRLFMQKPHSLYSLTHQVIFFLIADKHGCFADEEFKSKTFGRDPVKFVESLCGKVLIEANSIESSGYPSQFRDLLAEQVTVCAAAGYPHFLKRAWLETLLSWQSTDDSLGCFVDMNQDEEASSSSRKDRLPAVEGRSINLNEEDILNYERMQGKLDDLERWEDLGYRSERVKRSEEILKIGKEKCSVHFTAVCLGSLAMHLRYFTDTCLRRY